MKQQMRKTNYNLRDLCDLVKRELLLEMNCHALAKVTSFDATRQTVTCQILYGQQYYQRDPRSGKYSTVLVQYPLVIDCPVVVLGGGGAALTFPILAGDECLLMFNDRDIENWYAGTAGGAVATDRTHSIADGFALIGVRSKLKSITGYDTRRAALTFWSEFGVKQARVAVRERIVLANQTVDFKTQFDLLMIGLEAFLVATASATTAVQIATAAATFFPIAQGVQAQLDLLFETETP